MGLNKENLDFEGRAPVKSPFKGSLVFFFFMILLASFGAPIK